MSGDETWPVEREFIVNGEVRNDITTTEQWLQECGLDLDTDTDRETDQCQPRL